MDDAGRGTRGTRAAFSPELGERLAERYRLIPVAQPEDLGGSSSLNIRIDAAQGSFVARVYRPYVTSARLEGIQRARTVLHQGGIPCAEPVPARGGQSWTEVDGRLVEVERFVEWDAKMDTWERLEAGLPWLGRIHSLLGAVDVGPAGQSPQFANYVAPGDALEATLKGAERIRSWDPTPTERRLANAAEELAHRVAEAEAQFQPSLPRQLVHGDFWDNNVYFRRGRVVLVADFDFMGERARIDDVALTLYFANLSLGGDPAAGESATALRRLLDAYDGGLEVPLTERERAALPWAVARQPLWGIGGWVRLLDDEATARRHAAGLTPGVEWALAVTQDVERWRAAFA